MATLATKNDFPGFEYFVPGHLASAALDRFRIDDALNVISKVGGNKVGFLGLALKGEGGKSPVLEVMYRLRAKGAEVVGYDPTLRTTPLIDPNGCIRLELAAHLDMLRRSAEEVMDECETLVVTQLTRDLQALIASRRGRCMVVDLVDLFSATPSDWFLARNAERRPDLRWDMLHA